MCLKSSLKCLKDLSLSVFVCILTQPPNLQRIFHEIFLLLSHRWSGYCLSDFSIQIDLYLAIFRDGWKTKCPCFVRECKLLYLSMYPKLQDCSPEHGCLKYLKPVNVNTRFNFIHDSISILLTLQLTTNSFPEPALPLSRKTRALGTKLS